MKPYLKYKSLLLGLSVFCASNLFAQSASNEFENYAKTQNTLLNQTYDTKDAAAGEKILNDFVAKYNTLSREEKVAYKNFVVGTYYNVSCIYSINNNKVKALALLDSAVHKGYVNYKHIQEDTDFTNIRNEPEFKKIVAYVRSVGDYTYILKKANQFNDKDLRKLPAFTYQKANTPDLVAIRKKFNLDSVAGGGSDSSKAINILHWVHTTVKHDGQHESGIKLRNANEIVTIASEKKVGVSCGELATTLNECYLAMGFKTRKVYCFPKDSLNTDFDSHVINVVYLPSKNKWVWVDPTNDAYVMDEKKNMLSIQEVRERLIDGKALFINQDANYNHLSTVTKDAYLDTYMVKNLYRFYSPLKNEFNYESPGDNKTITYVYLMPLDYFKQGPHKAENKNKTTNTTIVRYVTNNDDLFWKIDDNK